MVLHLLHQHHSVGTICYSFVIWLQSAGMRLVSPWNPKARAWLEGRKGIFEKINAALAGNKDPVIWMHCASLGEFEQGLPILERLKKQYPHCKRVVTFFSAAGYELHRRHPAADYICYLPVDSKKNASLFINTVNPVLVLWIKCGFRLHLLQRLKKNNIPTLLVSGLFTNDQPFFHWYGALHRSMLDCFSQVFVQHAESAALLRSIGTAAVVQVAGDSRFDRVIEIAGQVKPIELITSFCGQNHPVIVAGNTSEEDEEELDHYANAHPEIKFIIAPHETDDDSLRSIKRLFRRSELLSELTSQLAGTAPAAQNLRSVKGIDPDTNVLIIDHFGMLPELYHYCTIAYVGGGFVDGGVHNVLEAAVYGKPVVFGPVIEQSVEALELVECGGGLVVDSALEVEEAFNRLLANPAEYEACCRAAKQYVYAGGGAADRLMAYIQENRLLTSW